MAEKPRLADGGNYVFFEQMAWPTPMDHPDGSLEWRLRYALPEQLVKDRYHAASIVEAYRELIRCPAKKREHVIRQIRRALSASAEGSK